MLCGIYSSFSSFFSVSFALLTAPHLVGAGVNSSQTSATAKVSEIKRNTRQMIG
jgi:hypothetical protein